MWHREQNINKVCKGGSQTHSGAWLFRKLVAAKTMASLEKIKHDSAPHMSTNVLNYLNKVEDSEQYPVARCDQGDDIYMNDRKASSSCESMNIWRGNVISLMLPSWDLGLVAVPVESRKSSGGPAIIWLLL